MSVHFDEIDKKIMEQRVAARDRIAGARVGDYVRYPGGQMERISHDWGSHVQTSPVRAGSFYLDRNGMSSFSGGLNPPIPSDSLTLTDEIMDGEFWFFHHDQMGAHRGVHFKIPCRVFETSSDYIGCIRM